MYPSIIKVKIYSVRGSIIRFIFYIGFVLVASMFIFNSKFYYPALPIETVSKKEVLEKLKSGEPIIELTIENGKRWYIINERNQDSADDIVIEMLHKEDWAFTNKEGSGLFFDKQGERLIVTTQKWTSDYVIVDIPR